MIGECILYIPLVAIAGVTGLAAPVALAMVTFFICKWVYEVKGYFHLEKNGACAALSYGVFLGIGLIDAGLGTVSPLMGNQPMVAVLLAVVASWAYALAGDAQFEMTKTPFKCATATPEEIRERGIRRGLKDEDIEFLIRAHRTRGYRKVLAAELGIEENSVKDRKRRLTAAVEK